MPFFIFTVMNRYILLPLLLCAIRVNAQIEWLETEHDFGAFHEADGLAECTFRMVNRGTEPVAIIGARANCGCTSPKYPVDAIAPGDTAAITVAYNPAGRPGRFTKYVQAEVSGQPRTRLTIRGVVIGEASSVGTQYPAAFGPLKLRRGAVMIGQVEKGRLKTSSLSMYNSTADSLRPLFTDMPGYLDAALVPEVVPPGEQSALTLYFRSGKCPLYGLVETSVTIIPDPAQPDSTYRLPVTAIVNEDFSGLSQEQMQKAPIASVTDSSLDLGTVRGDTPATGRLRLDNLGKSTLYIRRVYSTDPGISASVSATDIKKGRHADIIVTVDPSAISGKIINAKLSLITSDPVNPVQTLRVSGMIER